MPHRNASRAIDRGDTHLKRKGEFIEREGESIERLTSASIDDKAKFRTRLRLNRAFERAAARPSLDASLILERLVGDDDTLPFYVLELGAQLGRAVCKIAIEEDGQPYSAGTGFLIAPDLLLTNNHVLPTRERAKAARCIFDFELGIDRKSREPAAYRLDPDSLFLTSNDATGLDYTVVRIDAAASVNRAPIPLNRGSFGALKGEWAFVVQHPSGGMKCVALRNNQIIGDSGVTLHYLADTEEGSSGSPVFNSDWQLVGLHHATERVEMLSPEEAKAAGDSSYVNEGIKLPAIACDLEQQAIGGGAMARAVLGLFQGTDSLLGYFGSLGRPPTAANARDRVVEIYSTADRDLDIGYWRIEGFGERYLEITPEVARHLVDLMLDVYVLADTTAEASAYFVSYLQTQYGLTLDYAMADSDPSTALLWNAHRVERAALDWPDAIGDWFGIDGTAMEAAAGPIFARRPMLCRLRIQPNDAAAPALTVNLVAVEAAAPADSGPRRGLAARIVRAAVAEAIRSGVDGDWLVCGALDALGTARNPPDLAGVTRLVPLTDPAGGTITYLFTDGSQVSQIFATPAMGCDPADSDLVVASDDALTPMRIEQGLGCRPMLLRLSLAQPRVAAPVTAMPAGLSAALKLMR